jgi:2-C-methyl-D-erythritol 4-phosphate cytidylyltransferase
LKNIFIILAGGTGQRMGSAIPKQLLKIAGKPIIQHTLENIIQIDSIDEILIVTHKSTIKDVEQILPNLNTKISIRIIAGGKTRTQSTLNAINAINEKDAYVLLHDAVRPFIDKTIIKKCLKALQNYDAVDTAIVSADTIVGIDNENCINSMPVRNILRRGQTPQCFKMSVLKKAYELAAKDKNFEATDNCGVIFKYLPNVKIKVVDGSAENIKITENIDLQFADKIFQMKTAQISKNTNNEKIFVKKNVLIIGASYGIGKSCAQLLSKLGANVFPASRSLTNTDINDSASIEELFQKVYKKMGSIDLVILTAGQLKISKLVDMQNEDIKDLINIDLTAPALVAKTAYPYLKKSQGEIIFFTSSSYTRGRANYSIYSAAKAGVVNLTQALSDEWSSENIRVNCINPQRTNTPMRSEAFGKEPSESLLNPKIVAEYTIKTYAANITGQIVDVRLT